jgi:hypothetical protein
MKRPSVYGMIRGIPAGLAGERVVLRNRRATTIAVTDLRPVVEQRGAPLNGTLVTPGPIGGPTPVTILEIDLDAPHPAPVDADAAPPRTPFFADHQIEVEPGAELPVQLTWVTKRCTCTWRVQLTYRYRGHERTVTIPAEDQPPLRMTAFTAPYQLVYQYDYTTVKRPDPKTFCTMQPC